MLRVNSPVFNRLLDRIGSMPVVDCHEHLRGPIQDLPATPTEPVLFLANMYIISDLWAAQATDAEIALLLSAEATTDQKWPIFSRLWASTEHTAYGRVVKLALKAACGVEEITRETLELLAEYLTRRDAAHYLTLVRGAGIKAVLADVLFPRPELKPFRYWASPDLKQFLEGKFPVPKEWHPMFNLPYYHEVRFRELVDFVGALVDTNVTSLAEYEEVLFEIIRRCKSLGIAGLKDQSAYRRVIEYDLPPRGDAERLFNRLLIDPRNQLAWPEAKPLDDHLFHQCMRFARELGLPVQIHTGHMAGIRNRVDKTNAAHFASVLELHTRVQFDLFHGNWPYMGDLLYLAKNYPNVTIDLCWVNIIDPLYSVELLKRAVMTVPHVKIHGYGGDYFNVPEFSVAHLTLAREVIASALADLVECGWLEEQQATQMAADWLYNNPNKFYGLGLESYRV